jgi:hypothetical protein
MDRNYDEVLAEMLMQLDRIEQRMDRAEKRMEMAEKRMILFDKKLEQSIRGQAMINSQQIRTAANTAKLLDKIIKKNKLKV